MTRGLTVSIVGLGRAGRALLAECSAAPGVRVVGAWNRTARSLAEMQGSHGSRFAWGGEAPPAEHLNADLVLLAVSDDAVRAVSALLRPPPATCVVHLSGSGDVSLLEALPQGIPGCWHPLQAFSERGRGASVPPYAVALEGPREAVTRGRALATALGHPSVELASGGRAAYHAAAVLASNCLVALQATAARVMGQAGVDDGQAWQLLWPLVAGTLANLEGGPGPATLTGPVARGDVGTVQRNLRAIAGDPNAVDVYKALSLEAVDLAARAGGDGEKLAAIRAMVACAPKESD